MKWKQKCLNSNNKKYKVKNVSMQQLVDYVGRPLIPHPSPNTILNTSYSNHLMHHVVHPSGKIFLMITL